MDTQLQRVPALYALSESVSVCMPERERERERECDAGEKELSSLSVDDSVGSGT